MKTCRKCGEAKTLEGFNRDRSRSDGRHPYCRACISATHHERMATNPEYRRSLVTRKTDWVRENRERNSDYKRAWFLRSKYDISEAEYDALLAAQGGTCALCDATVSDSTGRHLSVDHDHAITPTRKAIRGILCLSCNTLMGVLDEERDAGGDPVALLEGAIAHLTAPSAQLVLA